MNERPGTDKRRFTVLVNPKIREVMKWQRIIAGAVDAAIRETETYIRHIELSRQQGERRD